jgi:hypothetical protein
MSLSEISQQIIDDVCVFKITENTYYGNIVHRGAVMGDMVSMVYGFIRDIKRVRNITDKETLDWLFDEFLCKVYLALVEINKAGVYPTYVQVWHPLGFFDNVRHVVLTDGYTIARVLDTMLDISKTNTKLKAIAEAVAKANVEVVN